MAKMIFTSGKTTWYVIMTGICKLYDCFTPYILQLTHTVNYYLKNIGTLGQDTVHRQTQGNEKKNCLCGCGRLLLILLESTLSEICRIHVQVH